MDDQSMQKTAQRLRIYIGESDRWRGQALDIAILETIQGHGAAGASIFRGIAGFGAHSKIHTSKIEVLSFDLPMVIEVIDSPEKISQLLEVINPMIREGLITVEDVNIIKHTHRNLNPLPADKLVSEVMTKEVVSIRDDATIFEAWKTMLKQEVKALPVIDSERHVVGILTDEDLLAKAGIQQRLSIAIRLSEEDISSELKSLATSIRLVKELMTHPVITIQDTDHLGYATAKMIKAGLKRLPVINQNDELVGMLSRLDILRQVAHTREKIHTDSLSRLPAGKTIGEVMKIAIPMVNQDDHLETIVEKFAESESHRLIVTDGFGKVVGLLSDSDVVIRVQPEKRQNILSAFRNIGKIQPGKETAFDLMSPQPLTAHVDVTIVNAISLMLKDSRKWLVVIDNEGKPIGLVDRQILLESIIANS